MYNNENNNDDYKINEDDYKIDDSESSLESNPNQADENIYPDYNYQNGENTYNSRETRNTSLAKILIIALAPVFFVAIFIIAFVVAKQLYLFETYNTQVEYTYNSKIKSNISTLESSIEKALEKNNLTSEELIEKYNQLETYYDEVETYARIEYANTCYYVDNANARRYKKYRAILDDMDEWFSTIKAEIYYSGYSADFFADYSDYEIDLVVNHPDTSESIAKQDEANELATEYSEIDEPTLAEGYEYLAKFVTLNNEFAELKGYDNYMEYAYYELYN
ncbi:MAG: M2 family metallopeptidase, partial [Acholeplasmatales bacterium]|nr:M2 family metallopeptidase [Acholeplasmatales bacterium]